MGFLADVGRSNAIPQMTQTFMGLVDLSRQKRLEQQNLAIQTQQMQLAQNQERRQQTIFDEQQKLLQQEETRRNKLIDITVHPMWQSLPNDEIRAEFFQDMQAQGIINEKGIGIQGNLEDFTKSVETTKPLMEKYGGRILEGRKQKATQAWDIYNQTVQKGDKPENIKKAYDNAINESIAYQTALGKFDEVIKLLTPKEKKYSEVTLYNIKNPNLTKRVSVEEGQTLIPEAGWTIRTPETEKSETTPIQYWGVISKIEDDARTYANSVSPKATGLSVDANGRLVLTSLSTNTSQTDIDKWTTAYQKHYAVLINKAKKMKALPKDYQVEPIETESPDNIPPKKILKEGVETTFKNGQVWTLRKGEPVKLK